MKLVVIYGPPAVGKLTVAEGLAKITGYKLYHNHKTIDMALKRYEFGTEEFNKTVVALRRKELEDAAREGTDTIFTSIFKLGNHQNIADEMAKMVGKYGGTVCFVYLYAEEETLLRRVEREDRKQYGKITETSKLKEYLETHGIPREAPIKGSLVINTENSTPGESAKEIVKHFGLRTKTLNSHF